VSRPRTPARRHRPPHRLERHAQIIIGGVSATALAAAPGKPLPRGQRRERPVARQDEHARADRGHSGPGGTGRDR